jgi:hypothetical protein
MSIAEEYSKRIDASNNKRKDELLAIFKEKEVLNEVQELLQILITPFATYRTRNSGLENFDIDKL